MCVCGGHNNHVSHTRSTTWLTGLHPSQLIGDNKREQGADEPTANKNRCPFPSYEKVSRESNASWNAKYGHIGLSERVRERKGSELLPLIDVGVRSPSERVCVCVCVWERAKLLHGKYDQHAAPAAAALITDSSLRHPGADDGCSHAGPKERCWPSSRDPGGQATPPPPN